MSIFKPGLKYWLIVLLFVLPTSSTAVENNSIDFISVGEISRGMKGYGLTVFEGTRIDTFAVEVVGIQEKSRVDGSLIIIEVFGHGLEKSSIAQGMSGSPIYLDGRFAGALAFGWSGALRPLAGVTPAQDMFNLPINPETIIHGVSIANKSESLPTGSVQDMHSLLQGHPGKAKLQIAIIDDFSGVPQSENDSPGATGFWPSADKMILGILQTAARTRGLDIPTDDHWFFNPVESISAGRPVDGPAKGAPQAAPNLDLGPALVPGAACAVPLVTGDATMGVTGTVTWTQGDDVLMMGHPFMQRGPVNLPLATAEILTVFPSREMSFKIGSIGNIVGSVHHDQRAGLSGKLGPAPPMIPVTVEVSLPRSGSESRNRVRKYHFEVVDDVVFTPSLVFWTLYNSILSEGDDASDQNVTYELTSHWAGPSVLSNEPLVIKGVASGSGGAMALAGDWMAPFALLMGNPFQKVQLKSVQAKIVLSRPRATAQITGMASPRNLSIGSGPVKIQVELSPRRGERKVVEVELDLPANLQPGPYRLVVASASEFFALETQRAAGRFQATSLGSALEILRFERAADELVVALLAPGAGLMLADREMSHLPASVAGLLKKGNLQIKSTMADYAARYSQKMPFALSGHAVRKLRVLPVSTPIREERRP